MATAANLNSTRDRNIPAFLHSGNQQHLASNGCSNSATNTCGNSESASIEILHDHSEELDLIDLSQNLPALGKYMTHACSEVIPDLSILKVSEAERMESERPKEEQNEGGEARVAEVESAASNAAQYNVL